jgi:C4-dicarboxylate-specific signal transduction histidine kinase
MKVFRHGGIRRKLTLIVMASSCAGLLLACLAFVVNDVLSYRQVMRQDLSTRAQIIGNNSTAALSFGDPKPVDEIMDALSADPHLVVACVFDAERRLFSQYPRSDMRIPFPERSEPEEAWFTSNHLNVLRDVTLNGRSIGFVFLRSDLRGLYSRVRYNAMITVLVLLAAMAVAFLLSAWLQRIVSDPLTQLAQVAVRVARDKDFSLRAPRMSDDELGELVECFNEMLAQIQGRDLALRQSQDELERRVEERTGELREANQRLNTEVQSRKRSQQEIEAMQQKLMETSRQAGMAEVATGVLHNVGNVLNSVNVSATVLQDRLHKSKVSSLLNTADLLHAHAGRLAEFLTEDPRGRLVPGYLLKLASHLVVEQEETLKELSVLARNIEHIKEIVIMQQSYAKLSGVAEILAPAQLVEDALRMNEAALARHHIKVVREYMEVPPVSIDKHKALQILVNLVRNAKQALKEGAVEEKRLTIRVELSGADKVAIVVRDNGVGIPPENLARIFQHGFTTKQDGHGFGLHSGANAAKEMGGSLAAASEGPGRGAVFTLELPVADARQIPKAA